MATTPVRSPRSATSPTDNSTSSLSGSGAASSDNTILNRSGDFSTPDPNVTTASREQRIAEAAYYRAERRNFGPGNELDDWLEAEREVDSAETQSTAGATAH